MIRVFFCAMFRDVAHSFSNCAGVLEMIGERQPGRGIRMGKSLFQALLFAFCLGMLQGVSAVADVPEQAETLCATGEESPTEFKSEISRGIDKCKVYLTGRDLSPDEFWAAQYAAKVLGGEFLAWASTLKKENSASVAPAFFESVNLPIIGQLPLNSPTNLPELAYVNPYIFSKDNLGRIVETMDNAINCVPDCDEAKVKEVLDSFAEVSVGYVLTHDLWALTTLRRSSCIDDAVYLEHLVKLGPRVLQELKASNIFGDFEAEQMAFLCYAGLAHWIPQDKVELALLTQNEDGTWPRPDTDGFKPSQEHTTALAMMAYAYLSKLEEQN